MVSVVLVAHCPAVGVNVYVVVAVLLSAGLHIPVIPLFDVVGSADNVAPLHIAATGVNVGVMFGLTIIVSVCVVAHCPAVGVNVYVVVAVLLSAGLHTPVIPLFDVVGSADNVAPLHIAATGVNVGVMFGLTIIVSVCVVAHCPAVGVNVYVVVAVLLSAGLHTPVIPLFDVVGSADNVAPLHIAATGVNVGVT
jgi:protein involved in ribonucleotide reduction